MDDKLRVLVVDDTVTYRKIVGSLLAEMPGVEVIGTAPNGKIALEKVEQLRPDLLLLDVEMPEVNGLDVLRHLRASGAQTGAMMLSALTAQGATTTVQCLELGAFDFVLKPSGGSMDANVELLRQELRPRLVAFARKHNVQAILSGVAVPPRMGHATIPVARVTSPDRLRPQPPVNATAVPQIVGIGISTGGPKALTEMLPRLPGDLPVPVLIVQHMPPVFTKSLAEDLDRRCKLRVREAQDGDEVQPGMILIAPGGKQMRVWREGPRDMIRITDDPPENSCRPSVDYLFRSVASVYGANSVGVIMTGMGSDGSIGCRAIKDHGGQIIAQDEASCVVFGMPRPPIEEGIADVVAPLGNLAAEIVRLTGKGRCVCK